MCQIQFIRRRAGSLTQRDVAEFFKLMELGSIDNDCAFGFFNDQVFYKDKGRFNLASFREHEKLLTGNFLVGHNRLATTGEKEKQCNNHPFEKNDFVLVHNGIIGNNTVLRTEFNIRSPIETDSYVILWLIDYYFQESGTKDRRQGIVTAIKKTTQKLLGSFSVFLYDRVSDGLYYFKNNQTSFSFCLFDGDLLIGSTNPVNLEHAYLNDMFLPDTGLFQERIVKRIENGRIYSIDNDLLVKELDSFESLEDFAWDYKYLDDDWDYVDVDDYLKMTTRQKIELALNSCLTYVPNYSFSEATGLVEVRHDTAILNDLQCFIEDIYCEDGRIYFSADELLAYLEGIF